MKLFVQHAPPLLSNRALTAAFWLAVAATPALSRELLAFGPADWHSHGKSQLITKNVLLQSKHQGERGGPVTPVEVALPEGYQYCRHSLDYHGWIGLGDVSLFNASPDLVRFGIQVRGEDGPGDQGWGTIKVTVTGVPINQRNSSCRPLPVSSGDVMVDIRTWVYDESERRDVQAVSAYPDSGFGGDPNRPERISGNWQGGYHWEGNLLCLEIRNLTAPDPSEHLYSIGYTVTLDGARFSDTESTKTLKLYSYRGTPERMEITQCFPVRR